MSRIQSIAVIIGHAKTLKYVGLSYQQWLNFRRLSPCTKSPLQLCRRKHPSQLLNQEINRIVDHCTDTSYAAWPMASIYHNLIRKSLIFCSLSTFYKYAALLVQRQTLPLSRRKNHTVGIRASYPFQIIHADITEFTTLNATRAYIYCIQDNFSRAILKYTIAKDKKASHLIDMIRELYVEKLQQVETNIQLLTDGGSENKPIQQIFADTSPPLEHLIAQKDIVFSNSMIEHLHRTIKYRYLYRQHIESIEELQKAVELAVEDYNNRPAHALQGLTPIETLNGATVDTEKVRLQIKEASIKRRSLNKQIDCCK